ILFDFQRICYRRTSTVGIPGAIAVTTAICILEVWFDGGAFEHDVGVHFHLHSLRARTVFGGDQDHTILAARSVERCGTWSFEYRYTGNVVRIDFRHPSAKLLTCIL